jgi:phage-related minor tail protein
MATIRNVVVKVSADASMLSKTLNNAKKDVDKFGASTKGAAGPLAFLKNEFGKMVNVFPQLKGVQSTFNGIESSAGGALSKITGISPATLAIGAAAAVAVVGVGVLVKGMTDLAQATWDVGMKYDTAFNKIRFNTAETGATLDSLKTSFKNIYTSSAMPIQDITDAMISVYQRLGLTGKALEELAKAESRYSKVSNTDLNQTVLTTTRTFGDWGVKTKDMVKTLDMLYVATAKTGVPTMRLNELVTQFGGPLRQYGFSLEASIALLGKFEKEGVNTELVMGAMRKGIGKWSKDGKDLEKSLMATIKEIKNAGSASKANAKAIEIFGVKAGPDMAAAIREGRFNIEELTNSLKNNKSTLADAAADTATFAGKMEIAKRKVEGLLEPIGIKLVDAFKTKLFPIIQKVSTKISDGLTPAMEYLAGNTNKAATTIKGHTKAIQDEYPWLKNLKSAFDNLSKTFSNIDPNDIVDAFDKLAGAMARLTNVLVNVIDYSEWMYSTFKNLKNINDFLSNSFLGLSLNINTFALTALSVISTFVTNTIMFFANLQGALINIAINTFMNMLPAQIRAGVDKAIAIVMFAVNTIRNNWSLLPGIFLNINIQIITALMQLQMQFALMMANIVMKIVEFGINASAQAFMASVGIAKGILSGLISLPGKMLDMGIMIMRGLVLGLKSVNVVSVMLEIAGGLASAFRSATDQHSPSKLFAKYGKNVIEGLANGLKQGISEIKSEAKTFMGFTDLFSGAELEKHFSGAILTRNLKSQVQQLQRYKAALASFGTKVGTKSNLYSEVLGKGVGALGEIQALNRMNPAQLADYKNLYGQKEKYATALGGVAYGDKQYRESQANQVIINITGNKLVTEEEEARKLANQIIRQLKLAGVY